MPGKPVATKFFTYTPEVADGRTHREQSQVWNAAGISLILQGFFTNSRGEKVSTRFAKKHMLTLADASLIEPPPGQKRDRAYFNTAEAIRRKADRILEKRMGDGERTEQKWAAIRRKYGPTIGNGEHEAASTFIVCNTFSSGTELKELICGAVAERAEGRNQNTFYMNLYIGPGKVLDASESRSKFLNSVRVKVEKAQAADTYALVHLEYGFDWN